MLHLLTSCAHPSGVNEVQLTQTGELANEIPQRPKTPLESAEHHLPLRPCTVVRKEVGVTPRSTAHPWAGLFRQHDLWKNFHASALPGGHFRRCLPYAGSEPDYEFKRLTIAAWVCAFWCSPHDLRHRYASVKIAESVPVTHLSAQLGHSKKSLTLDTYSHVLVDQRKRLAEACLA